MYVDFTNLNKVTLEDGFPLSKIDQLVYATIFHKLLNFMDAFSGYNQIQMHPRDREKNLFHHIIRHLLPLCNALWVEEFKCFILEINKKNAPRTPWKYPGSIYR